jgi:hypothetical protein
MIFSILGMEHGAWSMGQLVLRNNTLLILKFSTMFLLAQMLFSLQFKPHAPCSMQFYIVAFL